MQEAKNSTYEVRLRAVGAVLRGLPQGEVAEAYGVDRITIYRWLQRHRQKGKSGLCRRSVCGRPRKLARLTKGQWTKIVLRPASEFGFETDLWTSKRLQVAIAQREKIKVSHRTILRRLREADLTYQKPEKQYFEINEKERRDWVRKTIPKIRRTVRKYRAILYCEDEASVSLTAFLGKTWAPRGKTPKVRVTGKRGAVSAVSAISPQGRLVFRLHDKRIASQEIIDFLRQLLKEHSRRHLVIVMDQAPPHTSGKTKAFIDSQSRLHVFELPKYSPDYNPDEKMWNHLKHQELKSHQAQTKIELQKLAAKKLKKMKANKRLLRGIYFRCCVAELLS